ncbi:MAG: VacJ family lipoprotein [Rhodospirillaceae bacterium]|jgi:phospholipid-binding lipoprotein MlaA|nr:VacJ family lipoprotein [Rhodospirillaceae bacterium]MBT3887587.1 VacJ family lipoprotein [Rhodospirillaceae bacterium]MBT4117974.1 VacJ family lipoprotein [Rhodospirillaceae bacterium]MBT4673983.1 VacJ family lipoprotein [Rhodospirillaceae bacterium]MBT4721989.1 VacJ family lipoprotein [Rhodospirillaceae bacterium]
MWVDKGFKRWARISVLVLSMFVLANCASAPENDPEALAEYNTINDPVEPANRGIFEFNMFLDRALFRPVTALYRTIAPETLREFIHNFLQNLRTPVILANDLLQGEPSRGGTTTMRFLINSTIGVVGFGDPATSMGFEQHDEDFGQTLAVWGAGEGPYFMIPIFGPSNPRDAVGKVVDFFLDPINWWAGKEGLDSVLWGRTVMSGIDTRDQLWDVLDDLEKSSIDFYASIRSLYRQRRNDEITNGESLDDKPPPGFSGDFEIADPDQDPDQDLSQTKL